MLAVEDQDAGFESLMPSVEQSIPDRSICQLSTPQSPPQESPISGGQLLNCTFAGCGRTYTSLKTLREHGRRAHQPTKEEKELPFRCLVAGCNRAFSTQGGLGVHRNTNHGSDQAMPHKCTFPGCNKTFAIRDSWRKHQKVHDSSKASARLCSTTPAVVQPNNQASDKPKPFKCSFQGCDNSYSRKYGLSNHEKSHRAQGLPSAPSAKPSNQPKPYKCTFTGCDKTYTHKDSLRHHMRTHNSNAIPPPLVLSLAPSIAPTAPDRHLSHRYTEGDWDRTFPKSSDLKNNQGPAHGLWKYTKTRCDVESRSKEARLGHTPEKEAYINDRATSVVSISSKMPATLASFGDEMSNDAANEPMSQRNRFTPIKEETKANASSVVSPISRPHERLPDSSQISSADAVNQDLQTPPPVSPKPISRPHERFPDSTRFSSAYAVNHILQTPPSVSAKHSPLYGAEDSKGQHKQKPAEVDSTRKQNPAQFISSLLGTVKEEFVDEEIQDMASVPIAPLAALSNLENASRNVNPSTPTASSAHTIPTPSPLLSCHPTPQTQARQISQSPSTSSTSSTPTPSPPRTFAPAAKRLGATAYSKMALPHFHSADPEYQRARRPLHVDKVEWFSGQLFSNYNASYNHNRLLKMTSQLALAIASHTATAAIADQTGNVNRMPVDPLYNPDNSDMERALPVTPLTFRPCHTHPPTQARMFFTTDPQIGPGTYIERRELFIDAQNYQAKLTSQSGIQAGAGVKGESKSLKRTRKTCTGPPRQKRKYNWKGGVCTRPTTMTRLERERGEILDRRGVYDHGGFNGVAGVGGYTGAPNFGGSERDDEETEEEDEEEDNGMTERRGESQGVCREMDEDGFSV